jgi:hypothetical protein
LEGDRAGVAETRNRRARAASINDLPDVRAVFPGSKLAPVSLTYMITSGKGTPAKELIITGLEEAGHGAGTASGLTRHGVGAAKGDRLLPLRSNRRRGGGCPHLRHLQMDVKMVEIAVNILSQKPETNIQHARYWAVDVIKAYAKVPLSTEIQAALIENRALAYEYVGTSYSSTYTPPYSATRPPPEPSPGPEAPPSRNP